MSNNLNNIFGVYIIKKDQNVITIMQTENFDEAKKSWEAYVERWVKCINDKRPFIIDVGISATAFDPGLISEILIKSMELSNRINPSNPYAQQMQEQGFSNTFGRYASKNNNPLGSSEELLDRGYQF